MRYALALGVGSLLVSVSVKADSPPVEAAGVGTTDVGAISVPLWRGAIAPFELTVAATPNDCTSHPDVTILWDDQANVVHLHLTGKGVLSQNPTVLRTLGVDYTPNPFFPEPQNVVGGRYQFWVITAGPDVTFYYDPTTLNLIGSQYDFVTPPMAIPVQLPSLIAVGSQLFQPKPNGDLDFTWDFPYDHVTRGDLPQFAHHYVSFPPPNLCEINPYRIDLSTLRPYISPPQPASAALSFSNWTRSGFIFDLTIEPSTYYTFPPRTTLTATYSNVTSVAGAVPNNYAFDIVAAFMNVTPPIRPWPAAGTCSNYFTPMQTKNMNFCPPPGGAQ